MNAIKRSLLQCTLLLMFGLATLPAIDPVAANPMQELFDAEISFVSGSSYKSQKRRGVAFGSARYRNNLVQENLVAFRPPSMTAGCGGIDFYAGSFSVINGDQLVQMGRGIMQGAASYAFGLAMDSICPSCAKYMSDIQEMLNKFNLDSREMCQKGAELVTNAAFGEDWQTKLSNNRFNNFVDGFLEGASPDFNGSLDNLFNSGGKVDSTNTTSNTINKYYNTNVVWDGLSNANVNNWSVSLPSISGYAFQELLMSVIGTTVLTYDETSTADKQNAVVNTHGATITDMSDFFEGSTNDKKLEILKCQPDTANGDPTGYSQCLDVSPTEMSSWEGLRKVYEDHILDATNGLMNKVYSKTISASEQQFLDHASVPVMTMLESAGSDEAARRTMAMRAIDYLLLQDAELLTFLVKRAVASSMSGQPKDGNAQQHKEFIHAATEAIKKIESFHAQYASKIHDTVSLETNIVNYMKMLEQRTKSNTAN
ncbi:conjugal transfer protein TraH [Neiella sp. HB171785]|uniref:Conjugal transfer protein TraH n=1 Tax=Neiella litorisoli TaxID=2771431 RepID=A0A8J6QQM5_9GAMM|nr:conjugal transfer protein TraH [Neiella litorisoli]MBD1389496.1 conjugal transfer protein TraH [Neiella litorisoli]